MSNKYTSYNTILIAIMVYLTTRPPKNLLCVRFYINHNNNNNNGYCI